MPEDKLYSNKQLIVLVMLKQRREKGPQMTLLLTLFLLLFFRVQGVLGRQLLLLCLWKKESKGRPEANVHKQGVKVPEKKQVKRQENQSQSIVKYSLQDFLPRNRVVLFYHSLLSSFMSQLRDCLAIPTFGWRTL